MPAVCRSSGASDEENKKKAKGRKFSMPKVRHNSATSKTLCNIFLFLFLCTTRVFSGRLRKERGQENVVEKGCRDMEIKSLE